jgi:hypothetical protein
VIPVPIVIAVLVVAYRFFSCGMELADEDYSVHMTRVRQSLGEVKNPSPPQPPK